MSSIIFDPLYIKQIERVLGRKLDSFEHEAIRYGEPVYLKNKFGQLVMFDVPYYDFNSLATVQICDPTFFQFVFDGASPKRTKRYG